MERQITRTGRAADGQRERVIIRRGPVASRLDVLSVVAGRVRKVTDIFGERVTGDQRVGTWSTSPLVHTALQYTLTSLAHQTVTGVVDRTLARIHVESATSHTTVELPLNRRGRNDSCSYLETASIRLNLTLAGTSINGTLQRARSGVQTQINVPAPSMAVSTDKAGGHSWTHDVCGLAGGIDTDMANGGRRHGWFGRRLGGRYRSGRDDRLGGRLARRNRGFLAWGRGGVRDTGSDRRNLGLHVNGGRSSFLRQDVVAGIRVTRTNGGMGRHVLMTSRTNGEGGVVVRRPVALLKRGVVGAVERKGVVVATILTGHTGVLSGCASELLHVSKVAGNTGVEVGQKVTTIVDRALSCIEVEVLTSHSIHQVPGHAIGRDSHGTNLDTTAATGSHLTLTSTRNNITGHRGSRGQGTQIAVPTPSTAVTVIGLVCRRLVDEALRQVTAIDIGGLTTRNGNIGGDKGRCRRRTRLDRRDARTMDRRTGRRLARGRFRRR